MRALQVMPASTATQLFSRKEDISAVRLPQAFTDRMFALLSPWVQFRIRPSDRLARENDDHSRVLLPRTLSTFST